MINPLNDISRVYLEQISESAAALRAKKGIKEATKAKPDYLDFDGDDNTKESMKKALRDKVKQKVEEAKKPNDGNLANNYPPYDKVTRGDVIAGRLGKDQMGGKKKKITKEGFSNWRDDLREVIDVVDYQDNDKKVSEKTVKNKIKINPSISEAVENLGGELIEMMELDEEFILETVDISTEYFYEQGLNEYGLDILIEDMGLENFVDFVFEISEDYNLFEARTLVGTKKSPKKLPKGTAPSTATKKQVASHGTTRRLSSFSPSSSIKRTSVKKAVEKQPEPTQAQPKRTVKDRIAKGILGALSAYQSGMERHRAATATAGKALKVAGKGAAEFGKGVVSGVKTVGKVARDVRRVVGESEEQRINRALGAYYAAKKEKVKESVSDQAPLSPQELQVLRQVSQLDAKRAALRRQSLQKMKKPEPETASTATQQEETEVAPAAKAAAERAKRYDLVGMAIQRDPKAYQDAIEQKAADRKAHRERQQRVRNNPNEYHGTITS